MVPTVRDMRKREIQNRIQEKQEDETAKKADAYHFSAAKLSRKEKKSFPCHKVRYRLHPNITRRPMLVEKCLEKSQSFRGKAHYHRVLPPLLFGVLSRTQCRSYRWVGSLRRARDATPFNPQRLLLSDMAQDITGEVSDDFRTLASATAYTQGSSIAKGLRCSLTLSVLEPNVEFRRIFQAVSFRRSLDTRPQCLKNSVTSENQVSLLVIIMGLPIIVMTYVFFETRVAFVHFVTFSATPLSRDESVVSGNQCIPPLVHALQFTSGD